MATAVFAMTLITLPLSSCKKEVMQPQGNTNVKPTAQSTGQEKDITHTEGIISNQGYPVTGELHTAYYCFWGPTQGQVASQTYYLSNPAISTSFMACGATLNKKVFAYKAQGVTYMLYNGTETPLLINNSTTLFNYPIEEIEVHPLTGEVYALTKVSNAMKIYRFDSNGNGELMQYGSAGIVYTNMWQNGYKSGSITFVPNIDGTFRLVFSHESNVYAAAGITSWHFSITGNTLAALPLQHCSYNNVQLQGTGNINTTYGNGNLYFSRDAGTTNALYILDVNTPNSYSDPGVSVANKNDFGYFRN